MQGAGGRGGGPRLRRWPPVCILRNRTPGELSRPCPGLICCLMLGKLQLRPSPSHAGIPPTTSARARTHTHAPIAVFACVQVFCAS